MSTVQAYQVMKSITTVQDGALTNGCIYLLKAYSPVNRTGSPQGLSQIQILYKLHKKALNIKKKIENRDDC